MINGIDAYQMPPQDGITVAHFLTVADIERSLRFYETVFGSRILSRGDSKGPAAPVRVIEETPGYWKVAFDYPPFNILAVWRFTRWGADLGSIRGSV